MHPTPGPLLDILAREISAAGDLEALLERERAQVADASADSIETLAAEKTGLARRAAELGRSRDEALARAGLPAGRRGLDLACARAGSEWQRRLEEFTACVRRVRSLNERVGALIDLRLQHTDAALIVLTRDGPETAPVYSRDGRARGGNVSRARATA